MKLFLSSLLIVNIFNNCFGANVVCYYMGLNGYQHSPPEDIDPNLCTHLNYAFVSVQSNGSLTYANKDLDIGPSNMYSRVVALKERNPNLKVLLAVGQVDNSIFESAVSSSQNRANFVESTKYFLETYNFDGIDIDWEFPGGDQKENFSNLLSEIRAGFQGTEWLLTVAVAAIPRAGYDIPSISGSVHYINLMSYDYYGPWSEYTGQNSPLFENSVESAYEKKYLNVANTAANWVAAGAAANKINVGIAFYGRQFTLADSSNHGFHAKITGGGTRIAPSYSVICQEYTDWTRVWDDEQKNPYKYSGDQWVGYDDIESVQLKVEHILSHKYAGMMVWHLGSDDIYGICGKNQGLLSTINEMLLINKNLAN